MKKAGDKVMHSIRALTTVLLGTTIISACTDQQIDQNFADVIFTNARIYTVEDSQPWVEAVAIDDGKFIAVGTLDEVSGFQGEATRVVDLDGRLLMPAFGDAHVHPVFGAMAYSRCSLHDGESLDDYQEIIAGCISDTPGDSAIYGVGWEDALFPPNGIPRKEVLDEVSTDRALIFESVGGHSFWVNSKTLELAAIDKDTPDPENGKIDRDAETGEAIGGLQESATELVSHFIPKPSAEEMQDSILYVAEMFNRLGVTSWHDAGIDLNEDGVSETLAAYKVVKENGELNAHVTLAFKWANERSLDQIPIIEAAANQAQSWDLNAKSVKFYVDGVIPQHTAAMIEPYVDAGGERGPLHIEPDILSEAVTRLGTTNIQSHIHAIGDRAVRVGLDALEAAKTKNGSIQRAMISHLNVIAPDDQPRFGQLGVLAVFQPTWSSNYPYMDLTKQAIGPDRSNNIYPANGVLQAGGILAYGADWPVATADPLLGLEVAVTRINYEDPLSAPLLPEQGVSLEEAVKAHTLNVAYANHMENITGSIKVGKSADLIVLDTDIFKVPAMEISEASVMLTLFQGRAVYGTIEQFE